MVPEAHRYGPGPDQRADLWRPRGAGPAPVVVLIHGGFWRHRYTLELMEPLAQDLAAAGWAAWNIEYRRTGQDGAGGWPATLADVAAAIDALADIAGLDLDTVATCGHSAGGHLALWAGSRGRQELCGPPRIRLAGAVSLAGVTDLVAADRRGLSSDATALLLGGNAGEVPERYRVASPMAQLPLGIPQLLVHGDQDTTVPLSFSQDYTAAATVAGDRVRLIELAGADHMAVIDPTTSGWAATREGLSQLLAAPTPGF